MAGVIDADEIIDSGRSGGLQLAGVKLAFGGRRRVRLLQLDYLHIETAAL
jgi:hypothetical protein